MEYLNKARLEFYNTAVHVLFIRNSIEIFQNNKKHQYWQILLQ